MLCNVAPPIGLSVFNLQIYTAYLKNVEPPGYVYCSMTQILLLSCYLVFSFKQIFNHTPNHFIELEFCLIPKFINWAGSKPNI